MAVDSAPAPLSAAAPATLPHAAAAAAAAALAPGTEASGTLHVRRVHAGKSILRRTASSTTVGLPTPALPPRRLGLRVRFPEDPAQLELVREFVRTQEEIDFSTPVAVSSSVDTEHEGLVLRIDHVEATMPWRAPTPLDVTSDVPARGGQSEEAAAQAAREATVLGRVYRTSADAPDTPDEPPTQSEQGYEAAAGPRPRLIPLEVAPSESEPAPAPAPASGPPGPAPRRHEGVGDVLESLRQSLDAGSLALLQMPSAPPPMHHPGGLAAHMPGAPYRGPADDRPFMRPLAPPPQGVELRGPPPPGMDMRGPPPGAEYRGPGTDYRGALPPGPDYRGAPPPGSDYRGPPPPGADYRGPPPSADYRGPPPSADYRGPPPPGSDYRGPPPPGSDYRGPPPPGSDYRGPPELRPPVDFRGPPLDHRGGPMPPPLEYRGGAPDYRPPPPQLLEFRGGPPGPLQPPPLPGMFMRDGGGGGYLAPPGRGDPKRERGNNVHQRPGSRTWPPPEGAPAELDLPPPPPKRTRGDDHSGGGGGGGGGLSQVPCRFFNTQRGCRNGSSCPFRHDLPGPPPM
jgi:hypothetical protein